jgi:membrane protein DedA with SNARE-associated domain
VADLRRCGRGAIVGDNIGFWIGVTGGYRLARRYGPKVRLDERKLKVARYLFDRHGAKLVFFGRFVSVLRTYAAFLAGTNRMAWPQFLVANAAGGIVWAAIYTAAGFFAGGVLQRLSLTIDLVLGGIAALAIVFGLVLLRRRMAELSERAEKAYPGPLG